MKINIIKTILLIFTATATISCSTQNQKNHLYDDITFDPPANFFDGYEGRGRAAKEQEMEIDGYAQWGHDFKLIVDPKGDSTGFYRELQRMNEEQRTNWMAAYESENQEFLAKNPEGKELDLWKFNRYIKDYLRTIKDVQKMMHERLAELHTKYGDSDENNQKFIQMYLEKMGQQAQAAAARQARRINCYF
ncbi:MAG: hypothetical protein FD181_3078 [Prolixibacteraceae bacterium]|nr:MAG: hypothetical protein FD181_3078 [Prolixibacteraceae bacterium]